LALKSNPNVKRSQQNRKTGPILFLDVDGVISLFGFKPSGQIPGSFHSIDGMVHCIGHEAAARLARVAERYALGWATGWEEKANEYLVHILQMSSELPVLSFDGRARFGTTHWKLEAIDEYAGGRPAAWIDDNLDEACRQWAGERRAPTLLVVTDSGVGITDEHVEQLLRWADEVSEPQERVGPS
jgi:hypothetical protein